MSEKTIAMYCGQNVDDMTREDLIEAVKFLGKAYNDLLSPDRTRAYALGSVEMIKRGERQAA